VARIAKERGGVKVNVWPAKAPVQACSNDCPPLLYHATTAARCLRTDCRTTAAYFTVLQHHPDWNRRFLRTTNSTQQHP